MNRLLEGKVIAVTGGATGIGLAVCRRFGREGARVALIDMNGEEASLQVKALQQSGIEALAFTCDVSREEECLRTIQARAPGGCVAISEEKAGLLRCTRNDNPYRWLWVNVVNFLKPKISIPSYALGSWVVF